MIVVASLVCLTACSLDLDIESLAKNLGETTTPSTDPGEDSGGGGGGGSPGFVPGGPDIAFSSPPAFASASTALWVTYSSNVDVATITLSNSDIVLSTTGTVTGCSATFPWGSNVLLTI